MKRTILVCVAAVALAGTAWAQDAAQPDMTKMGPMARKPTNEKQTKKEIMDFFNKQEELARKGDMEAMLRGVDFPVYMVTDDLKGMPEAKLFSREEYVAMMKPFFENMPKDMKMTHKPTLTVLSDSLVNVADDFTMTMGKQTITGRSAGMLVKRDGQWKWKMMSEAGWGGMAQGVGGSGQSAEGQQK